jgi:hypothetical protein
MTDILLTDEGDLQLVNGDLVIADSVVQHQRELLYLDKGFHRYVPTVGVGVERSLLDIDTGELTARIRSEMQRDGLPATLNGSLPNPLTLYAD